jgi:transcriptional regulator with XRE-family HTH domain
MVYMSPSRYNIEIENFGKRLHEIRMKQKLSQLDLEVRSGINRTEISKIENGLKNIEFFTVVKLAEALEVELIEFFKRAKS